MKLALVAALVGSLMVTGAFAAAAKEVADLEDNENYVEEFTYLLSTDLSHRQHADTIRSIDTVLWGSGLTSAGMHKCAKKCKKEGSGGVCMAWTMCWDSRRCNLFSRLPSPLTPAKPSSAVNLLAQRGAGTYNAKCASGYSKAAATTEALAAECPAAIQRNTLFGDVPLSFMDGNRSRDLKAAYDPNQPSSVACCNLCKQMKDQGCTAWSYDPNGWMMDRARRCSLRQGANPAVSVAKGITSGVMN